MNILVTGANGLVGKSLCLSLETDGHQVTRVVRRTTANNQLTVCKIDSKTSWDFALGDQIDAVVHLAARVHVMNDSTTDSEILYRSVNTEGTLNLARQCAAKGVKRFVFISTVKVMGEGRVKPYTVSDTPQPVGPYALSKLQAEEGLQKIAAMTGMEVVVIRPPLVYGAMVGANFLSLMKAVSSGIPFPFSSIDNLRSLIYIGNLVDAITFCLHHPKAAGKVLMVSDGEDISTPELVRRLADALGKKPRLLPVPEKLLRLGGRVLGRRETVERLLGSLTVDISPIRDELGWQPPFTMAQGLRATAAWYMQSGRGGN